jgi:3-isopropylmalate/(R)-2-methylmalate dehydratase small subunit
MRPFTSHTGRALPLDRADVDTDQIVPAEHLKRVERTGFGPFLFAEWRKDPSFVLNDPRFDGASILLAGANFGSGSSREHAVWALEDAGFRVVIGPSFADIFYNNCFQNGILPIKLPQEDVDKLMDDASRGANATVTVDLENQEIRGPDGGCIKFDIDAFRKRCLLEGLDNIGLTLKNEKAIGEYESRATMARPWL